MSSVDAKLRANYKKLKYPEYYFGEDTRQNKADDWNDYSFRVLVVFLSCGHFRANSNTYTALNSIIDGKAFVDYCYFPYYDDANVLDNLGIPYIFGNVSHRTVDEYDLVLVSASVFKEMLNWPPMMVSAGIPLSTEERLSNPNLPLIVLGGSSASVCQGLMGEGSLVDLALFGRGEDNIKELLWNLKVSKTNKTTDKREILKRLYTVGLGPYSITLKDYLYYPDGYEYEYNGHMIYNVIKKFDYLPDRVIFDTNCRDLVSFSNRILNLDGSFVKSGDLLISHGCTGAGACSFCLEGNVGGPWHEIPELILDDDMRELRYNSAPEALSIFSYNTNYHSGLYDILDSSAKYFKRISLLSSRADVYADNKDFLDLAKSMGTLRVSIAAEGISDRVRNKFLNKNLPKDKYYKAVNNIISNGFLSLKINFILTGTETEDDFEEWTEDLKYFMFLKGEKESGTKISVTITNLIIYDQTPLKYERRSMALHSYRYKDSPFIKTYTEYLHTIREMGININIYGSGYSTCVEQLILDLGRLATKYILHMSLEEGMRYHRDFDKADCESLIQLVEKDYDIEKIFADRHHMDVILYSDAIIYCPDRLLEMHKEMSEKGDFSLDICMASGNSASRNRDTCYGCGALCYPKVKKLSIESLVKPNIFSKIQNDRPRSTIRMVLNRKQRYDYVSPHTQARLVMAEIMKRTECPELLYGGSGSNMDYIVGEGLKSYYSGKAIFDFELRDNYKYDGFIYSTDTFSLERIFTVDNKITNKDWNVFVGSVDFNGRKDLISRYNAKFVLTDKPTVKMRDTRKSITLMLKDVVINKNDVRLYYSYVANAVMVSMVTRMPISPYLVMKTLLPRVSLEQIYEMSRFTIMGSFTDMIANGGIRCPKCGEPVKYSLNKDTIETLCIDCYAKSCLYNYIQILKGENSKC